MITHLKRSHCMNKYALVSYVFFGFLLVSCGTQNEYLSHDIQDQMALKKIINDSLGQQVLMITHKEPRPKKGISYAWYRNRSVRTTASNYSGQLLNGPYEQFDTDHILVLKGTYKKGVRRGRWQQWYTNGVLKKELHYDARGRLHKSYKTYAETQQLVQKGKYRHGYKNGIWIEAGDTIVYKKGEVFVKDTLKPSLFKRIFKKKDTIPQATSTKEQKKAQDSLRPNFFKRLFQKKTKKSSNTK